MNTKYIDLINQTYYFPQEEFRLGDNGLEFHGVDLMALVEKYGAPLKFTYLAKNFGKYQFGEKMVCKCY